MDPLVNQEVSRYTGQSLIAPLKLKCLLAITNDKKAHQQSRKIPKLVKVYRHGNVCITIGDQVGDLQAYATPQNANSYIDWRWKDSHKPPVIPAEWRGERYPCREHRVKLFSEGKQANPNL